MKSGLGLISVVKVGARDRSWAGSLAASLELVAARLATALVAISCAAAIVTTFRSIPLRVSLNYVEGWNAYHASEVIRGDALYPVNPRFFINNYPPLSFYASALWGRHFDDAIVAGRWLSLAAFIVWTVLLVPTSRILDARWRDAGAAAALFAANMLLFTEYVGINDPELLGHAIAGFGLLVLVRRPSARWRVIVGATLMTIALFVKHNLIALPIACVIWLATVDRRAARLLAFAMVTAVAASIVMCVWAFGAGFVVQLVGPRRFIVARAIGKSALWALRLAGPGTLLVVLANRRWSDSGVRLCAIYAAVATLSGLFFIGGDGVNANVFFDAIWALSMGAALALSQIPNARADADRTRARMVIGLLMALVVAALTPGLRPGQPADGWAGPRGDPPFTARDVALIASRPGPALCEELALCFWAGKPAEVDVFNLQQRIIHGSPHANDIVNLLDARYFSIIQLDTPGRPLGQAFVAALSRDYMIVQENANRRLFVPR